MTHHEMLFVGGKAVIVGVAASGFVFFETIVVGVIGQVTESPDIIGRVIDNSVLAGVAFFVIYIGWDQLKASQRRAEAAEERAAKEKADVMALQDARDVRSAEYRKQREAELYEQLRDCNREKQELTREMLRCFELIRKHDPAYEPESITDSTRRKLRENNNQ